MTTDLYIYLQNLLQESGLSLNMTTDLYIYLQNLLQDYIYRFTHLHPKPSSGIRIIS